MGGMLDALPGAIHRQELLRGAAALTPLHAHPSWLTDPPHCDDCTSRNAGRLQCSVQLNHAVGISQGCWGDIAAIL